MCRRSMELCLVVMSWCWSVRLWRPRDSDALEIFHSGSVVRHFDGRMRRIEKRGYLGMESNDSRGYVDCSREGTIEMQG